MRRLLGRLERAIDELEAQNEAGEEPTATRLPEMLHDRKVLRDQVRETMCNLAGRDDQKYINLTDEDARMMNTRQGIAMAYNAQAMVSPAGVDGKASGMLITAAGVTDDTTDQAQLGPMMEKAEETSGVRAETTLADAGYHSGSNLEECDRRGQQVVMPESQERALESPYHKDRFTYDEASDSYCCPEGYTLRFAGVRRGRRTMVRPLLRGRVPGLSGLQGLYEKRASWPRSGDKPHDAALRRHRAWMSTEQAKQAYRQRKQLSNRSSG